MPTKPQPLRRNTFAGGSVPGSQERSGNQSRSMPQQQPANAAPGEYRNTRAAAPDASLRRALGENFRDADDAARVQPSSYPRDVVMTYTEPMFLALPAQPTVGIVAVRIRKVGDEETPQPCSGEVHWWWDGAQSRAVITSIDGLTPSDAQYRFNFLVIG